MSSIVAKKIYKYSNLVRKEIKKLKKRRKKVGMHSQLHILLMLNFDFLEKGLGQVSPLHFVYGFSRMFLMLYSN